MVSDGGRSGPYPSGFAFRPDSKFVYISDSGARLVSVIDIMTLKEVRRFQLAKYRTDSRLFFVEHPCWQLTCDYALTNLVTHAPAQGLSSSPVDPEVAQRARRRIAAEASSFSLLYFM